MRIRLIKPDGDRHSWLLAADGRLHGERWNLAQFESAVCAASSLLGLFPRKDVLKKGSVYEYDLAVEQDDILGHALKVAGFLRANVELVLAH